MNLSKQSDAQKSHSQGLRELLRELVNVPRDDPKYTAALAKISDHMIDVGMILKELSLVDELKYATDGIIRLRDIIDSNRLMWRDFRDITDELMLLAKLRAENDHPSGSLAESSINALKLKYGRLISEAMNQDEHMQNKTRTLEQKAYFNLAYVSCSISRVAT